jgi:hypothetical protein
VEVSSTPSSIQAMFDNNPALVCQTPCSVELPPGRHVLRGIAPGYREELKIFDVADEAVKLSLAPDMIRGAVQVQSEPAGLAVVINGQPSGQRTPMEISLPLGQYVIGADIRGRRVEQTVEVRDGALVSITLK